MQKSDAESSVEELDDGVAHMGELKDAFISALSANGVLGRIKAQLRASAVSLLRGDPDLATVAVGCGSPAARLPLETRVTLLLVRQFLQSHLLTSTAGVLEEEGSFREIGPDALEVVETRFPKGRSSSEDCVLTSLVREALQSNEEVIMTRANSVMSLTSAKPAAPLTEGTPPEPVEVDPNLEQLHLLVSLPAVSAVIKELEDSFEFSDEEGSLKETFEYERVDIL